MEAQRQAQEEHAKLTARWVKETVAEWKQRQQESQALDGAGTEIAKPYLPCCNPEFVIIPDKSEGQHGRGQPFGSDFHTVEGTPAVSIITFDTLAYVKTLREAGVEEKQAEAQAVALAEVLKSGTADLEAV